MSNYIPPVTIAEPVKNDEGFYVGFRISHPSGVECDFHPETYRCSCGRVKVLPDD